MAISFGPIHDEASWHDCANPEEMERFLGERGSRRRWQLFACACCWRIFSLIGDERGRHAVAVAQWAADGLVGRQEVAEALTAVQQAEVEAWQPPGHGRHRWAVMAARWALAAPRRAYRVAARAAGPREPAELFAQCRLLRDLFGNPFRPIVFDPAWSSPEVTAVARGVYDADEFAHTGVLADALEDAGCADALLLGHLRDGGPHVRGCWAVDLVLGKV